MQLYRRALGFGEVESYCDGTKGEVGVVRVEGSHCGGIAALLGGAGRSAQDGHGGYSARDRREAEEGHAVHDRVNDGGNIPEGDTDDHRRHRGTPFD
mmetsp:Transcript_30494/g.64572  ORF Transcript_30494/g.64572 Transcript_30494/m.64572 type:complete len:97 (+) Transcript_30494:495-785(+)